MKSNFFKTVARLVSAVMLVGILNVQPIALNTVYAADVLSSAEVVCSGTAQPGELVSFMVATEDADFNNLSTLGSKIVRTEIAEADSQGKIQFKITLNDIELDDDANITNYIFKSSADNFAVAIPALSGGGSSEPTGPAAGAVALAYPYTDYIQVVDGVVLVAIDKTLELLGVEYTYDSTTKTYRGTHNNGDWVIVMGKDTVEIDWVDVEMPAASRYMSVPGYWSRNMIPMYIFEDLLKIPAPYYDAAEQKVYMVMPGAVTGGTDFDPSTVVSGLTGTTMLSNLSTGWASKGAKGNITTSYASEVRSVTATADEYGEFDSGQVSFNVSGTYTKGDVALISFNARSTTSSNANVSLAYEREDWQKAAFKGMTFTPAWKKYYVPVYSAYYDLNSSNGGRIFFSIDEPMAFEVKDFSFINYGTKIALGDIEPEEYKGMEEDALWRKEAYRRIEKYRKDDVTVTVTDSNGNPVQNAKIHVKQTESEYLFGVEVCASEVVGLDTTTTGGAILDDLLDNSFNAAVCGLEMKTGVVSVDDGASGIEMANEFFARGMRMRGHALFWDGANSLDFIDGYTTKTYQELYDATVERVRTTASGFKGKLEQWDVVNEPSLSNYMRKKYSSTRLQADLFKEVKRIDPDVKLYVNETGIEGKDNDAEKGYMPSVINFVQNIKREGAPVDGIGIQAHCTLFRYPQGFYRQIDELTQYVDEVAVTEYDFKQNTHKYADEHLRDMLLATFSHPKTTAFMVWGVEDSMHWRNAAPFYDREWNERPAKAVWDSMVNDEFKTNLIVYTDAEGKATFRGFHGDYTIKCTVGGVSGSAEFKLVDDGTNEIKFTANSSSIGATKVSNKPTGNIEAIQYVDASQSLDDYDAENDPKYSTVYLDTAFKGLESNTAVLNGTATASATSWGTSGSMSGLVAGGDAISMYIKPTAGKSAELIHTVNVNTRYPDTEFYTELMFDTCAADAENALSMSLYYNSNIKMGSIWYSNGVYTVDTLDGTKLYLDNNTQYTLRISVLPEGGMRYDIMNIAGEVLQSYTQSNTINVSNVTEVRCYFLSGGAMNQNLFKLHHIRVGAEKNGEILNFSEANYPRYLIDEDMAYFDLNKVSYLGSSINKTSLNKLAANKWGLYGANSNTNNFEYGTDGKYLFAVRNTANGEHNLVKKFDAPKNGESLELTFNAYVHAPDPWNSTHSQAKFYLGNADRSTTLDIIEVIFNQYKNNVSVFGKNGTYKSTAGMSYDSPSRKVDLNGRLTLTPNGSNYDATLRIWGNNVDDYCNISYPGIMTAAEVASLEALYISSNTSSEGNNMGNGLLGVKNIRLAQSGLDISTSGGALVYDGASTKIAVPYDNVTRAGHDARLIVAAYDNNGIMIKATPVASTIKRGNGELTVDLSGFASTKNIDHYKVFWWDSYKSLMPYKDADTIVIAD